MPFFFSSEQAVFYSWTCGNWRLMASAMFLGAVAPPAAAIARPRPRHVTLASAMPPSVQVQPPAKESMHKPQQPSSAVAAAAAAAGLAVADVARDWTSEPADMVPSGATMAEFMMGYRRVLESASASGNSVPAAVAGADILGCVRSWLMRYHGHYGHVTPHSPGATWHKTECAVEACLWDLEADITRMKQQHQEQHLLLDLARLHCTEAASLLRRL